MIYISYFISHGSQVELVLPKQVCRELLYGFAEKPIQPHYQHLEVISICWCWSWWKWTKSITSTLRWFQLLGGVDVKSGLLILGVFTPSTSQQKHLKKQEHPPPPPPVPHIPYNANTRKIKVHQFSFTIQFVPFNHWLDWKRTLNLVDKASMQYLGTTERASPRSDDHPLLNGTGEVNCLCLLSYILYLLFLCFYPRFFPGYWARQLHRGRWKQRSLAITESSRPISWVGDIDYSQNNPYHKNLKLQNSLQFPVNLKPKSRHNSPRNSASCCSTPSSITNRVPLLNITHKERGAGSLAILFSKSPKSSPGSPQYFPDSP